MDVTCFTKVRTLSSKKSATCSRISSNLPVLSPVPTMAMTRPGNIPDLENEFSRLIPCLISSDISSTLLANRGSLEALLAKVKALMISTPDVIITDKVRQYLSRALLILICFTPGTIPRTYEMVVLPALLIKKKKRPTAAPTKTIVTISQFSVIKMFKSINVAMIPLGAPPKLSASFGRIKNITTITMIIPNTKINIG